MPLKERLRGARGRLSHPTFYGRFEHAVVSVPTALIVAVVASATWHLAAAVLALVPADRVDPANRRVFQAVFGMIFTAIIAPEFKHSLLAVLERRGSVVRVRSVAPIAPLAVVHKCIIVDVKEAGPATLFALAAATSALGVVDWLVRDQDRRILDERGAAGMGGGPRADRGAVRDGVGG